MVFFWRKCFHYLLVKDLLGGKGLTFWDKLLLLGLIFRSAHCGKSAKKSWHVSHNSPEDDDVDVEGDNVL